MIRRTIALLAALTLGLSFTVTASAAPQRILLMGSSTTGCTGPSTPTACYVNLVRANRPAATVTVLGRGGSYIGYGQAAENWTATPIPTGNNVVVVQLGITDWYVPVDPTVLREQVATLLGRVKAANPGARVVWLRTWMPAVSDQDRAARTAMWKQHGSKTSAAVIAAGGRWLDMDPTGIGGTRYRVDATGWHYNDAGHRALFNAVNPLLGTVRR